MEIRRRHNGLGSCSRLQLSTLQQAADYIHDWSQENHLQLNPTKCKETRTCFKRTPPSFPGVSILPSLYDRRSQLCKELFSNIEQGDHKLSHLLPARPRQNYHLRSNRKFVVSDCKTNRYRDSFIISHCT